MVETYRKAIGSEVWHFCSNCNTWPDDDYIASLNPEQIGREELCTECVARHDIGDCENYNDASLAGARKCPVIQHGRECGRNLRPELTAGIHVCSAGHRVLIVPPPRSKKS
jgi:hypothetical protein